MNAKLSKDRPLYPKILRTFEERRIDWTDGKIRKAIIIQPNFEVTGVNQSIWNLLNVAWLDNKFPHEKTWSKHLVEKKDFSFIENAITELLSESIKNLNKITIEDLG